MGLKTATWKIDEATPNATGQAEAWKEVLDKSGYSMQTSEVRSTVDDQGIRRAEFDMQYRNNQRDIAIINAIVTNTNARAEAGNEKYAGVRVVESEADRTARQVAAEAAAIQPQNRDRGQDVATKPAEVQQPDRREVEARAAAQGSEKQAIIKVDEPAPEAGNRGRAEVVKAALAASGARTSEIQSTTDQEGVRHSEIKVAYRTDQKELPQISKTLDGIAKQEGNQVVEHSSDRSERREIAKEQERAAPARTPEITR